MNRKRQEGHMEEQERRELEAAYARHDWRGVARLAERIILRRWPDCAAPDLAQAYYYAAM